jgi:hypothetical protein
VTIPLGRSNGGLALEALFPQDHPHISLGS